MASPLIKSNFADVLDPRFKEIFDNDYTQLPDMVDKFYRYVSGKMNTERFSQIGAMSAMSQFTGTVDYGDVSQGYDIQVTPVEFTKGIQVERILVENDQTDIINNKPKALADVVYLLRQTHRVRPFSNAF